MKRFICLFFILSLLCLCTSCEKRTQETVFAMDTVMDLQLWGKDAQKAAVQLKKLLSDQEKRWSATDPESALNIGTADPSVLSRIQSLSARTDGAFDPRLGAVMAAWGFHEKDYRVPTGEELTQALNSKKWDLGAAIKGYAGDLCVQALEEMDVDRAVLNLGGNIQTYGEKPDGTPWTVGIQNPAGGDYVGTVTVTGTASVVTSGDYQRYFERNGIRYHHIMDPATGRPAASGLRSVTVICRDGMTADALSTALFVMGLEKGAAHWQESNDFEAVFITTEGEVYATEGAGLSGCEFEVIIREN